MTGISEICVNYSPDCTKLDASAVTAAKQLLNDADSILTQAEDSRRRDVRRRSSRVLTFYESVPARTEDGLEGLERNVSRGLGAFEEATLLAEEGVEDVKRGGSSADDALERLGRDVSGANERK